MPVQPFGDPHPQPPPWAPYPDPLPVWHPVAARPLSPPGTAPEAAWWALDGQAVPGPVFQRLGVWGETWRRALFGPVQRVGVYPFPDVGPRVVVICERLSLVILPDAPDPGWRVQSLLPATDALVRAAAAHLPPAPGAPPL